MRRQRFRDQASLDYAARGYCHPYQLERLGLMLKDGWHVAWAKMRGRAAVIGVFKAGEAARAIAPNGSFFMATKGKSAFTWSWERMEALYAGPPAPGLLRAREEAGVTTPLPTPPPPAVYKPPPPVTLPVEKTNGMTLPSDNRVGPNCGLTALAVAAGVSFAEAKIAYLRIEGHGLRWRGATRWTALLGALKVLRVPWCEVDAKHESLRSWSYGADPNTRYMVRTTGHIQIVRGDVVTDQKGPTTMSRYWGRNKKVCSVVALDALTPPAPAPAPIPVAPPEPRIAPAPRARRAGRKFFLLVSANPHRPGTDYHGYFEALRGEGTVEDYLARGGHRIALAKYAKQGIVRMED